MQRDIGLDFVKGACVLAMAAHHAINYFPHEFLSVKYLHFVSGAFPFLAGFIVTHVSVPKYDSQHQIKELGWRLLFRGFRLLVLCGLLNLAVFGLIGIPSETGSMSVGQYLDGLFISHSGWHVSFDLLISIGYVLIALGVLCLLGWLRPVPLAMLAALLVAYCSWFHYSTRTGYYITYFTIGLVGSLCGFMGGIKLAQLGGRAWLTAIIYLPSLVAIVLLHQPFPIYVYSVIGTLLALYALGMRIPAGAWVSLQLFLWGRYSLILYLAQIALLILLRLFFSAVQLGAWDVWAALLATCALQTPICIALEKLRSKSRSFDRVYKTIFA